MSCSRGTCGEPVEPSLLPRVHVETPQEIRLREGYGATHWVGYTQQRDEQDTNVRSLGIGLLCAIRVIPQFCVVPKGSLRNSVDFRLWAFGSGVSSEHQTIGWSRHRQLLRIASPLRSDESKRCQIDGRDGSSGNAQRSDLPAIQPFGLSPGRAASSVGWMESAEEGFQIQGELDFESGNSDGFENWRRHQEATLEAVRHEWSLPVGLRTRVRLRHTVGELAGKLLLAENPTVLDRHLPLNLRMGRVDFTSLDIEDWCIEDEE